MAACGPRVRACVCVHIYLYTKPRQQKFRAMNGAYLASPIRGELGYAHWPQLGTQFIALLGTKFRGPLGKQDVCPNFALTAANFCSAIRATLGQRQIRQSQSLALNAHSGNEWGKIPVLTGLQPGTTCRVFNKRAYMNTHERTYVHGTGSRVQTRAVRRRHCVGGGAPVTFGGRRRRAAGPTKSAAARRVVGGQKY